MIQTLEEGLEKFKKTVRYYIYCESRLRYKYGDRTSSRDYGQIDRKDLQDAAARIEHYADLLGLTTTEATKIREEIRNSL